MPVLIITIIQTVLSVLTTSGILPGTVNNLVTAATAAIGPLWTAFNSGKGTSSELTAVLVTVQTAIDVVKTDKNIPTALLNQINALDVALQATLKADTESAKVVDPSTLSDIQPV